MPTRFACAQVRSEPSYKSRLARLFPPPTTCVSAHALASNRLLACDSWARGPAGYAGIKIIATRSGGDRTAWRREVLHEGLAKSRVYQEFWYVCQHNADAEIVLRAFEKIIPCGVGVAWLRADETFDTIRKARRNTEPDLALSFQDTLVTAFDAAVTAATASKDITP